MFTLKSKKALQAGFTMIELIVVIVILGILAATALPKFIDLRGDAQAAALAGTAGSLSSAMSLNYAGCSARNNIVTPSVCVQVSNCSNITSLVQGGALPTGYTVSSSAVTLTNGSSTLCTLNLSGYTPGTPVTFTAVGAGN
jgi:MSHA pilin protein MshA